MKITEEVDKDAPERAVCEQTALQNQIEKKSREFLEKGAELHAQA